MVRREVVLPELPGYVTLRCDFHMHTVFSDGQVWPTLRVDEAWRDGLDVIAITDHSEKQRFDPDIPSNRGRSYQIALPRAQELGMLLIPAAEITRGEPPGHLNALFLKDIAAVKRDSDASAVKSAFDQGAYIQWNHPGWKQPNRKAVWYPQQEEFFRNGWLHGLEVTNGANYNPIVHAWAVEKKLTMTSSSDVHSLIDWGIDVVPGTSNFRPMTLVFAKAKTEEAVKEAMFARRTMVFSNAQLCGDESLLKPFVEKCFEYVTTEVTLKGKTAGLLQLRNRSSVALKLIFPKSVDGVNAGAITLAPGAVTAVTVSRAEKLKAGTRTISLPCLVENAITAPSKPLAINLNFTVKIVP